jgi:translation initiation factor IF-2
MLASASNAWWWFQRAAQRKVQEVADHENIQIRFYDIIYKLIEEIKEPWPVCWSPSTPRR